MSDRSAYWKERSAKRRQDPAYREKQAEWNRRWRQHNADSPQRLARKAEQMRGYRQTHAERHSARLAVRRAIESGVMVRLPCEKCGAEPSHGHHDDYSKPLDVRWLCPEHHREHHAKATGEQP